MKVKLTLLLLYLLDFFLGCSKSNKELEKKIEYNQMYIEDLFYEVEKIKDKLNIDNTSESYGKYINGKGITR